MASTCGVQSPSQPSRRLQARAAGGVARGLRARTAQPLRRGVVLAALGDGAPPPPPPPQQQPVDSRSVPRRAFDFGWPFALLWAANRQTPVGDVPLKRTPEEWEAALSKDAYYVLVKRGTEAARSSPLDKTYSPGTYSCAACKTPLFSSDTKFDSGTGWPSFYDPLPGSVDLTLQLLYCVGDFGAREVRCSQCGGHLGHVFTDGPKPTGKRYCMNGVALEFKPE